MGWRMFDEVTTRALVREGAMRPHRRVQCAGHVGIVQRAFYDIKGDLRLRVRYDEGPEGREGSWPFEPCDDEVTDL